MKGFLQRIARLWKAHPGQEEFLLHPAKTKILACGRRWGKTDACAVQIIRSVFEPEPSKHLILAPTLDQARILFDRIVELLGELASEAIENLKNTPFPRFRFGKHSVIARSGHNGRSLRGNEASHIVVDEAAYVPEELITEIATPMLATTDGHLTLISTPKGKNHFWRFFQMGKRGDYGFWSRTAPSSESPYVAKNFLDIQKALISDRAYSTEYEAEFLDSDGCVFRSEAVEQCLVPSIDESVSGPFCIGVDWARKGDWTAVVVLSGTREEAVLCEATRIPKSSWPVMVDQVRTMIMRYPKAIVSCDATGIGDPLLAMLRTGLSWVSTKEFIFTNSSKSDILANLACMFENGWLTMEPNPELLRELEHFESRESNAGNAKFGATSGFHDDLVIALALAAAETQKRYKPLIVAGPPRRRP